MNKVDPLAKSLVEGAMELYRTRPWKRVPSDAPFLMRLPGGDLPLCVTIIGQDREHHGLMILHGEDGFERMRGMILEDWSPERTYEGVDVFCVGFEPLAMLPADLRKALQRAGHSARRDAAAPMIMHIPPGRQGRWPGRGQMRMLDACVRGVLAADERGELPRRTLAESRGRVVSVEVSGSARRPEVAARLVRWPGARTAAPRASSLVLDPDLADLPRTDERWVATLHSLGGSLRGDDRLVRAFIVADRGSELVMASQLVVGDELDSVASALAEAFRGQGLVRRGGRPREVACVSAELHAALAPGLAGLDVACPLMPSSVLLDEVARSLQQGLQERLAPVERAPRLAEWKRDERALAALLARECIERGAFTPRASKRYFTDELLGDTVLEEMGERGAFPALVEWVAADYRATRRSKTLVEKLLGRRCEPARRALLEARRTAELSIYRVDSTQPGASLEVEDVLGGGRHTVADLALSSCEVEGWFLPLRLLHVEGWTFPLIAGPPLGFARIDRVLRWLEDEGVDLAPGGLRDRAELMGQLWVREFLGRDRPVQVRNMDDEPLERLRAVYKVGDAAALRAALADRPDVDFDPDADQAEWLRPGTESGPMQNGVLLARLELVGDALLVEVNSRGRLERARAWIDGLPGARFQSVRALADEELPLDDSLPDPRSNADPEMDVMLERFAREQAFRWLDLPLPVLSGRTPREAVATPAGRRTVALLVRTMPAVLGPAGPIQVPRDELLRTLGIEV